MTRPRRKKERKKNGSETKNRTRVARLTGEHADHSATTPCGRRAQTYAIRAKPRSFKGDTESHHRIFAAVLTTKPDSPELRRAEPKVSSVRRALRTQPKQHTAL